MSDPTFWVGLSGSIILVLGAAWPDRKVRAVQSVKDWLFAIGGVTMLGYAYMQWLEGGPIFFVILEILVVVATVLMMIDSPDSFDAPVLVLATAGMIAWSLYLFEDGRTILFIVGLCGVGLGYALDAGSVKREAALTMGSAVIALFSYFEGNWIFFWLNLFFAVFSGWYLRKAMRHA